MRSRSDDNDVMIHEEQYTKGHVALYCYQDGYNTGPLPKELAKQHMDNHLRLQHGFQNAGHMQKVSHRTVEHAMGGKKNVPAVNKGGGFKGHDDVFPQQAHVYPFLGGFSIPMDGKLPRAWKLL
jgi:hypothetical protein